MNMSSDRLYIVQENPQMMAKNSPYSCVCTEPKEESLGQQ